MLSLFKSLIAKPFASELLNVALVKHWPVGLEPVRSLLLRTRKGLTERAVTIHLDGGELQIDWRKMEYG